VIREQGEHMRMLFGLGSDFDHGTLNFVNAT
jgi:hypothetical protein